LSWWKQKTSVCQKAQEECKEEAITQEMHASTGVWKKA
jgi:hypothetical protein